MKNEFVSRLICQLYIIIIIKRVYNLRKRSLISPLKCNQLGMGLALCSHPTSALVQQIIPSTAVNTTSYCGELHQRCATGDAFRISFCLQSVILDTKHLHISITIYKKRSQIKKRRRTTTHPCGVKRLPHKCIESLCML